MWSRLPFTRDEVTSIAGLYPRDRRTLLLGAEATEDRLQREPLADYRYLHFATHGVLDAQNPSRSGLALAQVPGAASDGVLRVRSILTWKLDADLVTLSACNTALGLAVNGEGVLGLSRAFLYAGARATLVSLWSVNDAATADLMPRFYAGLKQGLPPDSALRQAKLNMLRGSNPLWRHPYFWAAFVMTGPAR
jgi:CHAT domain-containing protein